VTRLLHDSREEQSTITKRKKIDRPKSPSGHTKDRGKAILRTLAPSLQDRGVAETSYIIVNPGTGEFVTGKTPDEARRRFASLHPGVEGLMQRFADVISDLSKYEKGIRKPSQNDNCDG
jgi:hypothetical protein